MSNPSDWIGRASQRGETITDRQLAAFRATFDGLLATEPVPPGFHWCLMPDVAGSADLGRDGHPRLGIFMPDLALPRRMWAGGQLDLIAPLEPGDRVVRDSVIEAIDAKTGSTGKLAFVTVRHSWSVEGSVRISERQDIVYREEPAPGKPASPPVAEDWPEARLELFVTDPVLLFRYSALTFNGHRIHYDHPYATSVEGYAGLVVHGPMQAMLMLNMATRLSGQVPRQFRYRGLSPLIAGEPARIEARPSAEGLDLRVRTDRGVVTMTAATLG